MSRVFYNEFDPKAAGWLQRLADADRIPKGFVDGRSIVDVRAGDLDGFDACHFFAGIGGWPGALRAAGWPDDRPVWTASLPCQPFSSAGAGKGFDDHRHLWPVFFDLVRVHRPCVMFGEQVASKAGLAWLDSVQTDLENEGYTFAALDLCSAGVGAPNIRQRLYWVAYRAGRRCGVVGSEVEPPGRGLRHVDGGGGTPGRMADCNNLGRESVGSFRIFGQYFHDLDRRRQGFGVCGADGARLPGRQCEAVVGKGRRIEGRAIAESGGSLDRRAGGSSLGRKRRQEAERSHGEISTEWGKGVRDVERGGSIGRAERIEWPGPVNGFWRDSDWIYGRDGKWRPVEPGTFPLASRIPGRVVKLRGYGNAVNFQLATTFIETFLEIEAEGALK